MKESMLNKKNVHSYPSHIVAVIESGEIAQLSSASSRPLVNTTVRNKHENAAAGNNSSNNVHNNRSDQNSDPTRVFSYTHLTLFHCTLAGKYPTQPLHHLPIILLFLYLYLFRRYFLEKTRTIESDANMLLSRIG
jgi:hypothetical protein